jgi:hypothetical protein
MGVYINRANSAEALKFFMRKRSTDGPIRGGRLRRQSGRCRYQQKCKY